LRGVVVYNEITVFILGYFGVEEKGIESRLVKIHGSAKKGNIIFGAGDDADEITVFGHSLGKTDHMYFKDFFANQCCSNRKRHNINISVYGEDRHYSICEQVDALTTKQLSKFRLRNNIQFIDTK